eukprot:766338-Hanusia_phi.AAC.4
MQAGRAAFKHGKLEEALEAFRMALEEEEEAKEVVHSNMALCCLRLGRYPQSLEHANRSTQLNPRWAKGWARKVGRGGNGEGLRQAAGGSASIPGGAGGGGGGGEVEGGGGGTEG